VVLDQAFGEVVVWDAVGVSSLGGVDCVGAVCAVDDGLCSLVSPEDSYGWRQEETHSEATVVLFEYIILERLPIRVLRVPDLAGLAALEIIVRL
jgi:hypothetical protein